MITLIADPYHVGVLPEGALAPTSSAEYVAVRIQVRRALDTHSDLTIYLRDPVMLHCFEDLHRYQRGSVTWHIVDPARDFEQFFGLAPAAPFTPAGIAAVRLDTMRPPPEHTRVDPLSWVLGERVGDVWRHETPPTHHLDELAAWAVGAPPLADSTIRGLAAEQLARWSRIDQRYAALRIQTLSQDAAAMIAHSALRRYDPSWQAAQPWGSAPTLDQVPLADVGAAVVRPLRATIAQYWRERYAASGRAAETVSVALAQMSGLCEAELTELAAMLAEHPEYLTATRMEHIRARFQGLPEAARVLDELEQR